MWNHLQLTTVFVVVVMQQVTSAQNDCGNTSFSGSAGIVTSPNFPLPYPHNISCTYSIEVGRNNSALLKFLNFDLESPSSGLCRHDWLMITCNETGDENVDFRRPYCGTNLPRTSMRFSNCPVVQLRFFADSTVNGGGFAIAYNVSDIASFADDYSGLDCGETVLTNSTGVIYFPLNPTDYPATVHCIYTISTNERSRISLGTTDLQGTTLLDSFTDCDRDNITVVCSSGLRTPINPLRSHTFCLALFDYEEFEPAREIVFHNCSVVKIFVHSTDYTYRNHLGYREVDNIPFTVRNYDTACGTTSFTGPTGIVTSPKFPLTYAHNLNCFYSIDVDRTKTVSLEFISLRLEGTSDDLRWDTCNYDWITVNCLVHGYVPDYPHHQNRKYCGERSKPMTLNVSKCDTLTLNFVSDSSVTKGGFQIRYTTTSIGFSELNTTDPPAVGCGNTSFSGPVGFIASPRFPLSYPHNLSCVYSLDVDATKIIVLRFLSFSIEGTSHSSYLDRCIHDWLMISCISNGSVAESSLSSANYYRNRRYCGVKETPLILGFSNCQSMTFNFVTDSSITSGGFQLRYRISSRGESDCGDTLFSGQNGVVTSPSYPFPYPHNASCKYSIDVGRSNSVLLKFKNFDLEIPNSMDQCKDWLMISCNERTKANPNYYKKYCGSIQWVSSMRFLDCPALVLEFFSDSTLNSRGFFIEYTVIEDSSSIEGSSELDCGITQFTNSSGVINLPMNPNSYLATVDCTYTITADHASFISIDNFHPWISLLQSFQDCNRESLTVGCVREGESEIDLNTIRVFCRRGGARGPLYNSLSSEMLFTECRQLKLSIRSHTYDNQVMLRIPYEILDESEICGNTNLSTPSGFVSSVSRWHHARHVNCLYTIDSGHVSSFLLYVFHLRFEHLEMQEASCDNNSLKISCLVNGTSRPRPLAERKLCGAPFGSTTIIRFPACRRVLLNYSSEYISELTGFALTYQTGDYDLACGNTTDFDGPDGFITSPRFPLSYTHNLDCMYSITGGQGKTILLSSISFFLEGTSNTYSADSNCYSDWLTVSCLSDQSAFEEIASSRKYCGYKTKPLNFAFPNCEVVVLNFLSDESVSGGGFKFRYTVVDTDYICGVPVYGPPSGEINFLQNTTEYGDSFDCDYLVNASQPSSISLTVWSISLLSSGGRNCQRDWLLITCINGLKALDHKITHSSCDNLNSSTQLTFASCAAVKVVNHKDSDASGGKAFRVEYTVTSNGEPVVATPMNQSGKSGRTVGITLTVLVLIGAICLGAFWLLRRQREKNRPEMLIQASELEARQLDLDDDNCSRPGFGPFCNEEQDTSRYVPLRSTSLCDQEEP